MGGNLLITIFRKTIIRLIYANTVREKVKNSLERQNGNLPNSNLLQINLINMKKKTL